MADTAAFFAKKKKGGKKKTFKAFNANKIDVSAVSSSVHVDAPAVSTDVSDLGGAGSTLASTSITADASSNQDGANAQTGGEQWDDEALAARLTRPVTGAAVAGGGATELLDMKALESKRREQDDIAERMRVEETKAQLAKAREGMEKEAQRMKEEKEAKMKAQNDAAIGKPRFGVAAVAVGGDGPGAGGASSSGKWVPPHLRGGGGLSARTGMGMGGSLSSSSTPGSTFQRKVDMQDENLFPDLAKAEAIITQQQEQQKAAKAIPKKAKPGVSAWGGPKKAGMPKTESAVQKPHTKESAPAPAPVEAPETKKEEQPEKKEETVAANDRTEVVLPPSVPAAPATASANVPAVAAGLKKKKKKKKDLSTFKASSS